MVSCRVALLLSLASYRKQYYHYGDLTVCQVCAYRTALLFTTTCEVPTVLMSTLQINCRFREVKKLALGNTASQAVVVLGFQSRPAGFQLVTLQDPGQMRSSLPRSRRAQPHRPPAVYWGRRAVVGPGPDWGMGG